MTRIKDIQGKKQKSIIKRTLFATLMLFVAVGVKAQTQKLGKPVSGLYNSDITAITAAASATTVVLNDLEDHSWSYYSDASCPIRSLNPADVTITYYGNGTGTVSTTNNSATPGNNSWTQNASGVQISYNETANTFVYYKTLERTDGSTSTNPTGRCAYTTIPNPFSKRPTYGTGDTRWRGFYAWRVRSVSGGTIHTAATGGTQINAGGTINAETEVFFAPTASTGMTVQLEALWARAYVVTSGTNGANEIGSNNVGYERNFLVLTTNNAYRFGGGNNRRISNTGYAATISRYYPDGTVGSASATVTIGSTTTGNWWSPTTTYAFTLDADTKFENLAFSDMGNQTITANGHNLIVGRGVSGTVNILRGMGADSNSALNYTIRLESGVFNYVSFTAGYYNNNDANQGTNFTFSGTRNSIKGVLGCDYDRAIESNSANYNYAAAPLRVTYNMIVGASPTFSNQDETEFFNTTIKSGYYGSGFTGLGSGSAANSFYLGVANTFNTGKRKLTIEGGRLNLSLAGGIDEDNTSDDALIIRMKGGTVAGAVYGAAAFSSATGGRRFIFTGGNVGGWIAGGANGTQTTGGKLDGKTFIYFGGTAQCNSNGSTTTIGPGNATGGNIFGAGSGNSGAADNATVGEVDQSTVVIADNAYVERNVYGGGNYGYVAGTGATNKSDMYILGGTVDGNVFGGSNMQKGNIVNYYVKDGIVKGGIYGGSNARGNLSGNVTMSISGGTIEGGVYGGGYGTTSNSCNVTGTVDITMTGGTVLSGLYGGGNVNSKIGGNTTLSINGGQVGTTTQNANIHGGGYGQATSVAGNVSLTLGTDGQTTQGVTVYGDVYGGSALGTVNTNTSNTTTVNLYKGNIYGNAYGGGLGDESTAAIVNGNVAVNLNGAAFGKATIKDDQGNDIVSKGRVFGCNNVNGTPKGTVTVHVYKTAGINGAAKPARNTDVYEVQAVYGGGNLAAYQPTASNTATTVIIDGCGLSSIAYVYGGGNAAPVPATDVTVNGSYEIDYVFGGGNGKDRIQSGGTWEENPGADVGKVNGVSYGTTDPIGTTTTTIYGGVIHHVFGGSNTKGDVTKEANVILGDQNLQTCEFKVDEVYGAGNEAYMSGNANITLNCIEGLTEIYGGSRMADIGSSSERKDVNLTIHGGRYTNVFGGNNLSGRIYGKINVTIQEDGCLPIEIDHLYLGGNKALYSVFGYNNDAGKTPKTSGTSYGDPELYIISATRIGEVYGGGYGEDAIMYGNPHININMEPGEVNGEYVYISSNTEHPDAVSPTEYANYDKTKTRLIPSRSSCRSAISAPCSEAAMQPRWWATHIYRLVQELPSTEQH